MKTRMQPIGNAWAQLPRVIRDLAVESGKKIELQMFGAETELDRQVLELIKDPLTHMVRNSSDHGIETPQERKQAGKPETGTLTLNAFHAGGHVIIEIADDGKGLDIERISHKIIANGLASEAEVACGWQEYRAIVEGGRHAGAGALLALSSLPRFDLEAGCVDPGWELEADCVLSLRRGRALQLGGRPGGAE